MNKRTIQIGVGCLLVGACLLGVGTGNFVGLVIALGVTLTLMGVFVVLWGLL